MAPFWHQFHFVRPLWLLALLPLSVLWLWLRRRRGGVDGWRRWCDPALLEQLLVHQPGGQRRYWLALLALGWLCAVLALAGPTWQRRPLPLYQNQAGRVVVLDLSQSMLARDLQPSRLARARFKIRDLLAQSDTRTGLVVYAGAAFTVVPLTRDAVTIDHLLPALKPDLMPARGNRPGPALTMAGRLLSQAGVRHGQIILIAAQADTAAARAAGRLRREGQRVAVLAVGTPAGAPIPNGNGGFVTNGSGHTDLSRLDRSALQAVARAGGGRYTELTADDSDIRALTADQPAPRAGPRDNVGGQAWLERGSWLVLLLLPLAALGFRRGWLLLLLLWLPVPRPAAAWSMASLWQRADQQAYQALREHRPAAAEALAQSAWIKGTAAYRAGHYAAAAAAFARVDSPDGAYNRGNALVRLGRYREALAAYDRALASAPGMADARANRALVEQLLRERKQRQHPAAGTGRGRTRRLPPDPTRPTTNRRRDQHPAAARTRSAKPRRHSPQQNGGGDAAAARANGSTAMAPGESGHAAGGSADRLSLEQEQTLKQWLRRIPDDPGGLLRRKFRQQYEERHATMTDPAQ